LATNTSRLVTPPRNILYPIAGFSLVAALIHLWVIPEHFEEWWGYGLFFLIATIAQALYAVILLRWPSQKLVIAGIVGNSAIILLYLVTRTIGIPFFGPEAGEIEEVSLLDVGATVVEALLVVALGVLLLRQLSRQDMALALLGLLSAGLILLHLPHIVLFFRLIFG
jgi:hypothetical protein